MIKWKVFDRNEVVLNSYYLVWDSKIEAVRRVYGFANMITDSLMGESWTYDDHPFTHWSVINPPEEV